MSNPLRPDRRGEGLDSTEAELAAERHRLEQRAHQLAEDRRLGERALAMAPLILWVFNQPRRRLVYISPQVETLVGIPAAELMTQDQDGGLFALMRPGDRDQLAECMRRLAASADGTVEESDYLLTCKDGRVRWFAGRETVLNRSADGRVEHFLGIMLDVTEARELLDRLGQVTLQAGIVREKQRRQLANALHDGPGQLLPLARTKLHMLREEAEPAKRAALADELDALLRDTSAALSRLTQELRPPALRGMGMMPALRQLAAQLELRHGLRIALQEDTQPLLLPPALQEAVLRAVRELLVNVAKHAGVDEARIALFRRPQYAELVVEDSGVGFDPARASPRAFGLRSVREQLRYLGADVVLRSAPGKGTCVLLRVPLAVSLDRQEPAE
jgi:PAS domain S-box-containing protein